MGTDMKTGQKLYEELKSSILSGKYGNGDKLPSIRVLSEETGLGKKAVNSVIRLLEHDGLVMVRGGSGTYVSGSKHEPRMIGVMLMDFCDSYTVEQSILKHIQLNLPSDYYLGIVNVENHFEAFVNGIKRLHGMGAAGYIVVPPKNTPYTQNVGEAIELLNSKPTVLINRPIDGVEADMYSMNLGRGIEKAMEYLSSMGHTRTAVVLHDADKFIMEEMEAYIRCCRNVGTTPSREWLIDYTRDYAVLWEKIKAILPQIDSLILPDMLCANMTDMLRSCGKRIPEEFSIIGINDTIYSRVFYLPLTSISYPAERVGRHAISKVIRRIEGMDQSPHKVVNFDPELIIRNT